MPVLFVSVVESPVRLCGNGGNGTWHMALIARRIQSEMRRLHDISPSVAFIHKSLSRHQIKPLVKYPRKSDFTRYQHPIPDERVQMDPCTIAPGLYQYTAEGLYLPRPNSLS